MNILLKLTALVFVASLAACQHTESNRIPQPVDPVPPTVRSQHAPSSAAARSANQQQAQRQPQTRSTAVITLHLAQRKKEPTLVEVDAGGPTPFYALPRPVLTQSDIARVSPVNTSNGSFILLEMNVRGIPKLDNITRQALGQYLLLSVQGNLVSMAKIGEVIKDGRLLIPTQNSKGTQAIIRLMRGGT